MLNYNISNVEYKYLTPDEAEKPLITRRNDIQWLRAIAIISVLIFHLDSSLLPNGYVGVDM